MTNRRGATAPLLFVTVLLGLLFVCYLLDEKHVVFLDVWVYIVWQKDSDLIHPYKHKFIYSIMLNVAVISA